MYHYKAKNMSKNEKAAVFGAPPPTGCWSLQAARRRGSLHSGVGLRARACGNRPPELHKKPKYSQEYADDIFTTIFFPA